MRTLLAVAALFFLVASASQSVAPIVPSSFSYQGVLLDNGGQPQSGPVDLVIRLWDQGFAGTLLYKQEFNNTPLVDGVFSVQIGPSGVGIDTPTSPLTINLLDAVTFDLGASGAVWIEVSVDGNTPLTRTQLRAVPFAFKAETASELVTPGGVSAAALDAIWQNFNFDGGGPSNTDSREGIGDADQDGILNFVDPDNDNDGFTDIFEVNQGSDINLVTPRFLSISGMGSTILDIPISATGQNFDPGMSVTVGGAGVTPTGVTPSSFDFLAPPMPVGTVPVVATLPNGESSSTNLSYVNVTPQINSFSGDGLTNSSVLLTATGTDFDPGLTLTVGGIPVTPSSITSTSLVFEAPLLPAGPHPVQVTHPSGGIGSRDLPYADLPFASSGDPIEAVAIGVDQLLVHADANYGRDTTDDGGVTLGPLQTLGVATDKTSSMHWDSTGRLAALRRNTITGTIEVVTDTDLDGLLEVSEAMGLISVAGNAMTGSSIIHDHLDRPAVAYLRSTATHTRVQVHHDRNADGDFLGEGTLAELVSGPTSGNTALAELAADSAARLAYVYEIPTPGEIRVAWDRNGDADFFDSVSGNPERFVAATTSPTCIGSDFDGSDALVVVYGDSAGLHLLHDTSGDGDFADAGEAIILAPADQVSSPTGCDVDASGAGLAIAVTDGSNLSLLVDRNADGDFADTNEDVLIGTSVASPIAVERLGNGTVVVVGEGFVTLDPN